MLFSLSAHFGENSRSGSQKAGRGKTPFCLFGPPPEGGHLGEANGAGKGAAVLFKK